MKKVVLILLTLCLFITACNALSALLPSKGGTTGTSGGGGIVDEILSGDQFVVRGKMEQSAGRDGCLLFRGDNGARYYLFQHPDFDSDDFDLITVPGTIARLVLVARDDLQTACSGATSVEVLDVLELLPPVI
jgi:hypothetical protein